MQSSLGDFISGLSVLRITDYFSQSPTLLIVVLVTAPLRRFVVCTLRVASDGASEQSCPGRGKLPGKNYSVVPGMEPANGLTWPEFEK